MATPLVVGLSVATAAVAGQYGIHTWHAFKTRPLSRKFYEGRFQPAMTSREAALILGLRDRDSATSADKVKEAHRKVMVANHPDAGSSDFLASKVNKTKDVLLGKARFSGSAF